MANAARWVHRVRMNDRGFVEVTVGPNSHTMSRTEFLSNLPRHEVRRVCAHLGLGGAATRSKDDMLDEIRAYCADESHRATIDGIENVVVRRSDRRSGNTTPTTGEPASGSPDSTPRGSTRSDDGGLGFVLDAAIRARVDDLLDDRLGDIIARIGAIGGSSIDVAAVEKIVEDAFDRARVNGPRVVHSNGQPIGRVEGRVHRDFDRLLTKVASGCHMFITGEAGIGKTHCIEQIAEALGVESVIVSADPLPQRAEILGGISPITREVIKGAVRDVYEHGGVFCLDEIDTGHTSLGTSLNRLLSSSSFDFDKDGGGKERVVRHPKFVVMATGNTFGTGPSIRYVGTNKMNGAGLDRFKMFHMDTDENLTREIVCDMFPSVGLDAWRAWEKMRRNVERYSLDVLVSPRACIDAARGLNVGEDLDEAFQGRARGRGLPIDIENKVVEGVLR